MNHDALSQDMTQCGLGWWSLMTQPWHYDGNTVDHEPWIKQQQTMMQTLCNKYPDKK